MFHKRLRIALLSAAAEAVLLGPAAAETVQLREIVIDSPSPIRQAPRRVAPQGEPVLQGTMPVVTDQFATVTIVPKEELARSQGGTLGDVLQNKPGITTSSFAPGAASRPIIRGLDNYRVRIQENGLAVNDVSDLSEDHGVPIDPLGASQVEVVRGPATLRYGSQAIGGVVSVDNNRIPTFVPLNGLSGEIKGGYNSVDHGRDGAVVVDAGKGHFAVHGDAFGRGGDDYAIPAYPYLFPEGAPPPTGGRQPNSYSRASGGAIGGSYIFDSGFVGASVSQFGSLYGIPGQEATETNTRIDLRQTKFQSKGEYRPDAGSAVGSVRFWAGATDYAHDEIANEGGFNGIQQTFKNRAQEGRAEVQFNPVDLRVATLNTAIGAQASHQDLSAPSRDDGLFDPNRSTQVASYIFNEFTLTPTTRFQLAGRIERVDSGGTGYLFPADYVGSDPIGFASQRNFLPKSGSAGLLQTLPLGLVASLTGQYVERAPRTPELYSRGMHEATGTFEIGNPTLGIERARSVEIGLRRAEGRLRFEATAFSTSYDDFIFKRLTGNTCEEDFASCTAGTGGEFQQVVYSQQDARFHGAEFAAQLDMLRFGEGWFGIDTQYDIVRARLADGNPVPRLPPQRYGGGLFYRDTVWFARVGILHADAQTILAPEETPTPGYNNMTAVLTRTIALSPGASIAGPKELTLGLRGDNLLDDDMRNAVSFKKDEVLLPGRTVRVFARLAF